MKLYRYEDQTRSSLGDEDGYGAFSRTEILLRSFLVEKETPCGYWIPYKKWVSKTARRRYAYPTKEEAWGSFKARKKRQILILTFQLNRAKAADALPQPNEAD
jgi:hypothetical protein